MIKLSLKENFSTKILNLIKICLLKIRYPFTDFSKEGIPVDSELDWYHNEGLGYFWEKKYDQAIEMFKKEIELDELDFLGHWNIGKIYKETGKKAEALSYYEIALKHVKEQKRNMPDSVDPSVIMDLKKELTELKKELGLKQKR